VLSETLERVVVDFDQLYECYTNGGLIGDRAGSGMAKSLLGGGEDIARFGREFLLIDALVRNRVGRLEGLDDGHRHLVVFGGNNVGKSTIINILAGQSVASVSPEGGHTRHAHAFWQGGQEVPEALFRSSRYAFRRLQLNQHGALGRAPLNRYGVSPLASAVLPPTVVLWDTPDCDAVGAERYLCSVIEAVAVADVVIYVTTSQKAAVDHLVEWFLLLGSAGVHMLECINRTALKEHQSVIDGQKNRFFPEAAKRLGISVPDFAVVGLKYMVDGEEADLWDVEQHPQAANLRQTSLSMLGECDPAAAAARAVGFAVDRIDRLLEPARIEAASIARWDGEIEGAIEQFAEIYEQQYLTSDKVIEPFTRLNLQILELLDPNIPGLREVLALANTLRRWPAKLVLKVYGHIYRIALGGQDQAKKLPAEVVAYKDAHEHVLERLSQIIDKARNEPRHHPFWDVLASAWRDEFGAMNGQFARLVEEHMKETDRAIKQAAADIFNSLKQQPNLLMTLQGAKVAVSVGGIAATFFVPHAGTYVLDVLEEAVLAPAMLAGVAAATAKAVQTYVTRRKEELVAKLKGDAATIAAKLYREPLQRVASLAKSKAGTLGVDQQILDRVPEALKQLQLELEQLAGKHHER
jgi:hypothetical protein